MNPNDFDLLSCPLALNLRQDVNFVKIFQSVLYKFKYFQLKQELRLVIQQIRKKLQSVTWHYCICVIQYHSEIGTHLPIHSKLLAGTVNK